MVSSQNFAGDDIQVKSVYEDKFRDYDGRSLEVDCLPAIVTKILHVKHCLVDIARGLGHGPFEVCK